MTILGDRDVETAWDLAFILHAKGLGAVMTEKAQTTLDEVLVAVDPEKSSMRDLKKRTRLRKQHAHALRVCSWLIPVVGTDPFQCPLSDPATDSTPLRVFRPVRCKPGHTRKTP